MSDSSKPICQFFLDVSGSTYNQKRYYEDARKMFEKLKETYVMMPFEWANYCAKLTIDQVEYCFLKCRNFGNVGECTTLSCILNDVANAADNAAYICIVTDGEIDETEFIKTKVLLTEISEYFKFPPIDLQVYGKNVNDSIALVLGQLGNINIEVNGEKIAKIDNVPTDIESMKYFVDSIDIARLAVEETYRKDIHARPFNDGW